MINRYNNETHRYPATKHGRIHAKRNKRKYRLNAKSAIRRMYDRQKKSGIRENPINIPLPHTMSLTETVSDTSSNIITQFDKIYKSDIPITKVVFNFNSVRKMDISGAIYFYGLVQYLRFRKIEYKLKNIENHLDLQQGLYHLDLYNKKIDITNEEIKNWKIIPYKNKILSSELGTLAYDIQEQLKLNHEQRSLIYDTLEETLQNGLKHPYQQDDQFKHFYAFVKVIKIQNQTFLVMCTYDHGRGFRESYHKNPEISESAKASMLEYLKTQVKTESKIIQYIITYGKSGTQEPNRGRGLNLIQEQTNKAKGRLIVYSRKGYYDTNTDTPTPKQELHGTLVQTQVPI